MQTFPKDNRATSLHYNYFLFRRRVAQAMFGKPNYAELNDYQRQEVEETIDEGLHMYCTPPVLPPPYGFMVNAVHEWSFMRPIHKFTTSAGQRTYNLPPNFERPISNIFYQPGNNLGYGEIKFTNTDRTLRLENRQEEQAPPRYFSIQPSESTGIDPQQQDLVLHPTPDASYDLQMQYQAMVRRLTADQPFPLGGQAHGPGILAACLAAAEYRLTGMQGSRYANFLSILAGNIIRDYQRRGGMLGYNGNDRTFSAYGRGEVRDLGGVYYRDVDYGGYMGGFTLG